MKRELQEKIDYSIDLIRRGERLALALDPVKGYQVAFSGGKDSQVVLELVKMAGVKYEAVHNVTGIDSPTTMHFIRDYYPEVRLSHPKENFFQLVEKYNLPMITKRYCCSRLKEGQEDGCVVVTGVRAEESAKRGSYEEVMLRSRRVENKGVHRTLSSMIENEHRCIKGKDKVMLYPILKWTTEDVFSFLDVRSLTVNPSYYEVRRVGCMFCPFASVSQIEYYEETFPGYKRRVLLALRKHFEKTGLFSDITPEEYYERWKNKVSIVG